MVPAPVHWPGRQPARGATVGDNDSSGDSSAGFDGAKLVGAGLALVSSATAAVGAFTGALPRLLRNHPWYFLIAVFLVLVAITLSFVASEQSPAKVSITPPEPPPMESAAHKTSSRRATAKAVVVGTQGSKSKRVRLISLAFVVFAVSAAVLIAGLLRSISTLDQPRLAGTWTFPAGQQPVLTVKMQLDNLQADQTVFINAAPLNGSLATPLYRSQTGADLDGNADETFDIPLPIGATGLQVVASVAAPTACDGAALPVTSASAGTITPIVSVYAQPAAPSPAAVVKSTVVLVPSQTPIATPVSNAHFSCIQVQAPIAALSSAPHT